MDLYDLAGMAWSQRVLIAVVFAALFLIGAAAAFFVLQPSYEAHSRLLVILDGADPTPSAAGSGGQFQLDQVMQSETEILNSDIVRAMALERVGRERILSGPGGHDAAMRVMAQGFSVTRQPNASVLVANFKHKDAEVAALTLNAIVDSYLTYRLDLLAGDGAGGLSERSVRADTAYVQAQAALSAFLVEHGLSDLPAERAAAAERLQTLQTQRLQAATERDAALAGAGAYRARLADTPESVELYVDNGATNQLLELQVERQSLLARYQPDAPPVAAVERQIEALQALIASGQLSTLGLRRMGANPVRQALDTERLNLESRAASEARRVSAIEAQIVTAQADIARLRDLAPAYERLARGAAAAAEAANLYAGHAAEAAARRATPGAADAVRVIDRAQIPTRASSLRRLGFAAAFVFAAGAALFFGLARGYWLNHFGPAGAQPAHRPVSRPVAAGKPPRPRRVAGVSDLPVLARVADRG